MEDGGETGCNGLLIGDEVTSYRSYVERRGGAPAVRAELTCLGVRCHTKRETNLWEYSIPR